MKGHLIKCAECGCTPLECRHDHPSRCENCSREVCCCLDLGVDE